MSKVRLFGLVTGVVVFFCVIVFSILFFGTNIFKRNGKDGGESTGNQLPFIEERKQDEENSGQNRLDHKKGYICFIPSGWNVNSVEEDKDIPLEQSKAIAISKEPHKGVYPLNYYANIAIYIYDSSDDLFEGGGFNLEGVNDLLIQKDELLGDDEEIVEQLDVQYRDAVLDGVKGKEYFLSAKTSKENLFLEDNYLIKVKKRIYALSFHDLGPETKVNENLSTFQEFCKQFELVK